MTQPDPPLNVSNLSFIEELYEQYLQDPRSVDAAWQQYFDSLRGGSLSPGSTIRPGLGQGSLFNPPVRGGGGNGNGATQRSRPAGNADRRLLLQDRVDQLIRAYRIRGHLAARVDPLDAPRPDQPELDPAFYGFSESDLDLEFSTSTISGLPSASVRDLVAHLRRTYCSSIGVQFQHIEDLEIKRWLEERMESSANRTHLSRERQIRILQYLSDAVIFEEFIQKKFLGAKSFSLEGAESLIPLLDLALEKAGTQGVGVAVIGMAHRGRLNVLANIMGKSPRDIFHEFEDVDPELSRGRGDVKYHLGYSADRPTENGGSMHLSLSFNPSHLEYANPVVLGRMRAKMDRIQDLDRRRGLVLMIHGDAAFAGEGVVQETLNLSQLQGYAVGGSVHVIVNNQVGFTTDPKDGRSSTYAADVARMLHIPIFHVNGEDPEAVAHVVEVALDFRERFQRDVVIDMYCFRRRGHNEGDEPAFTQPLLYEKIRRRKPVRETYLEHLLTLGGITREEADAIVQRRREHLEDELSQARSDEYQHSRRLRYIEETLASSGGKAHTLDPETWAGIWSTYRGGREPRGESVHTAVQTRKLKQLLERQTQLPEEFTPNSKITRRLEQWQEMALGERPLDWGAGEALAFATLAVEGCRVRMTGQDCERGTFSHRHAVLHDSKTGERYTPLQNLQADQAPVEIYNSPLSEAGVLGYEWGYSLDCPDGLVLWEAQFGDFANCAQVIIDQFLVSAEDKWRRLSGLVLLLPHGHEGMGPEHSSARLERFLMLCAEDNIQVVNLTTPAQLFHCLRRQMVRRLRKPLIVMSPKSLLRHPGAVSEIHELAEGTFQKVIPDDRDGHHGDTARVLLCSGKLYYELLEFREERKRHDVAIVRLEQLYPLVAEELESALAPYPNETPLHWVQEEPQNMGAFTSLKMRFGARLLDRYPLTYHARRESASPATGSSASHKLEQRELIAKAFGEGES